MNIWLLLIPATGPVFFYFWHQWVYRWSIFDGTTTTFLDRLKRDVAVSLPGNQGDVYRYNEMRSWIQKYARMERPQSEYSGVSVPGIPSKERFRNIALEKRYMQYQDAFLPAK